MEHDKRKSDHSLEKRPYGYIILVSVLGIALLFHVLNFTSKNQDNTEYFEQIGHRVVYSVDKQEIISANPVRSDGVGEAAVKAEEVEDTDEESAGKIIEAAGNKGSAGIADADNEDSDVEAEASNTSKIITSEIKKPEKPSIAIMISNLGLSKSTTEKALELPEVINLGFSPYSYLLREYIDTAFGRGHEILLNLPMEPTNYPIDDPGPYALLTELSNSDNLVRLEWTLSRSKNYIGVYSVSDEKFSLSSSNISPILKRLKEKGLIFMYSNGDKNSSITQMSAEDKLPFIIPDVEIDKVISESAIAEKLEELEKIAKEKGYAVGVAQPYPVSIKAITNWVPQAFDRDIHLVKLTSLFKKQ